MYRRAPALVAALLGLALGATACSDAEAVPDPAPLSVTSGPTASAAPATGSSLSPAEFADAARLPGTVVVDVRTPEEYAEGHLDGAVLMDLQDPQRFAQQLAELDRTGSYAIYCRSGSRSAAAMAYFEQLGFESYFDLAGGIGAWTSAGGSVAAG